MKSFMDFEEVIELLSKIIEIHQIKTVDIGALEPFLYYDNGKDISHLIQSISNLGLKVKITTNGSLLYKFAEKLSNIKIDKIRISLHSLNKDFFKNISNSDRFDDVIKSIEISKKYKLPIEINSLIFKGCESEILSLVKYANNNKIKLKIYNLYYSPFYRDSFNKYYIKADDIIEFLKLNLENIEIISKKSDSKRNRILLRSKNTTFIVKDDKNISRDNKYCQNCHFIKECGEQFAEYIRVDTDMHFYPCYLRKDLRFNLKNEEVIRNLSTFSNNIKIRLIVSSICNFKCVFPDNNNNCWCLKQGGDYKWRGKKINISISDYI
jgi:cyclic pyranopterin phosphate synthase